MILRHLEKQGRHIVEESNHLSLSSSWYLRFMKRNGLSLKRNSVGAFTVKDICNMDESSSALFSDQSKKSVNDVGASNEINEYISNKVIYSNIH